MPSSKRFPFGKYGPSVDPHGEYVALDYQGRRLLGEIRQIWRDEIRGCWICLVWHFNGEQWPIEPALSALEWIQNDSTEVCHD